jgi:hypothetical protein
MLLLWIMQKKPVKWSREIRNIYNIISDCSKAAAWAMAVLVAGLLAVVRLAAATAVMEVMAAMEIMEGLIVEPEICAVTCGAQTLCVNVWEVICAHACK